MSLILFHSSKTMQSSPREADSLRSPALIDKTTELAEHLKTLSPTELAKSMHISSAMADKTSRLIEEWGTEPKNQSSAIDSFLGDMYSGLQAPLLSTEDRKYADAHLRILSGLYGVLRPLDRIMPYRLEMGYKFPQPPYDNLYSYWTDSIISRLPDSEIVFNLSSVEYTKSLLPHFANRTVITPVFMTIDGKTGKPRQVVVHSKIARGAYVRWLIQNKISTPEQAKDFDLLGYKYQLHESTEELPLFICEDFNGKGLSPRENQEQQ